MRYMTIFQFDITGYLRFIIFCRSMIYDTPRIKTRVHKFAYEKYKLEHRYKLKKIERLEERLILPRLYPYVNKYLV